MSYRFPFFLDSLLSMCGWVHFTGEVTEDETEDSKQEVMLSEEKE
ncbi:MAG: hypothetical protein ACE3JP_08275 [Ectobacillus sp.]